MGTHLIVGGWGQRDRPYCVRCGLPWPTYEGVDCRKRSPWGTR